MGFLHREVDQPATDASDQSGQDVELQPAAHHLEKTLDDWRAHGEPRGIEFQCGEKQDREQNELCNRQRNDRLRIRVATQPNDGPGDGHRQAREVQQVKQLRHPVAPRIVHPFADGVVPGRSFFDDIQEAGCRERECPATDPECG